MLRTLFVNQLIPAVKTLKTPVLVAALAAAFLFTPNHVIDSQAGNRGISTHKFKGHKIGHSDPSIRLGGDNQSLRPVNLSNGHNERRITKRYMGNDGSRTFTRTISVLDGNYGNLRTKHHHKTYGRLNNIRRYGKVEYNSSKESRAGVIHNSGQIMRNKRKYHGLQQIAGANDTGIVSGRLTTVQKYKKPGFETFTKGELIAIGVAVNGYYELAGGGQGASGISKNDDCAYGTYCTIDLGGPKIITFNDTGDIQGGELADEELSDEAYLKEYGEK